MKHMAERSREIERVEERNNEEGKERRKKTTNIMIHSTGDNVVISVMGKKRHTKDIAGVTGGQTHTQ
jgi:hypothetical protein